MKNRMKYIILAVLLVTVSVMSCSCMALDERKENRAVWKDDTHKTIVFRGKEYEIYEGNTDVFDGVILSGLNYFGYPGLLGGGYTLTEADVPVLLSNVYGETLDISYDKDLIRVFQNDNGKGRNIFSYYVSADKADTIYETYFNILTNPDHFCYPVPYFGDEYVEDSYMIVPENIEKIFRETYTQLLNTKFQFETDYEKYENYGYFESFYLCNSDKSSIMNGFELLCHGEEYCIRTNNNVNDNYYMDIDPKYSKEITAFIDIMYPMYD